jgi:lipopolysaccharide transport system ATP-binding protein
MASLIAKNLGKAYRIYERPRARLAEWATAGRWKRHREFWALRGIDLHLQPGDAVGIVGSNGAGKSTLLEILAGTTVPTEGAYQIEGRVAAILELGVGFHPHFSGRQNAVMACQMAGLADAEIAPLLPEIERFSELGSYLEQPLRTYSSGMQMRLAFATATAVLPEVLIVDEALSVGDAYFQQKCMQRIRSFLEQGTTLLFVSHDANAILALCARALLLEGGLLVMDDAPRQVLDYYQGLVLKRIEALAPERRVGAAPELRRVAAPETASAEGERFVVDADALESIEVELLDAEGRPVAYLPSGAVLEVRLRARFARGFPDPHLGFGIKSRHGQTLYETDTHHAGMPPRPVRAGERFSASFRLRCALAPGDYAVVMGVANGRYVQGFFENPLFLDNRIRTFTVILPEHRRTWAGLVDLAPTCEVGYD